MKTRVSALAAVISSASMLTACGGGGSSLPDFTNSPTPAPTVKVTVPATATSGTAFDVTWTSTNATSCTTDFSSDTTTSGTALETNAVGTKTFSVTCTGAGGTGSDSQSVHIGPAGAEGAWQGATTTSNQALSGVVTHEGDYWLAYNATSDAASAPAGFYAGGGSSADGTFTSTKALRSYSFSSAGAQQGTLSSGTYTAGATLGASLDSVSVPPPNVWDLNMTANNAFAALQGNLVMNFTGTYDDSTAKSISVPSINNGVPVIYQGGGKFHGNTHSVGLVALDLTYDQDFGMEKTTGRGRLAPLDSSTCTDTSNGAACIGFGPALAGNYFNTTTTAQTTKTPFTPVDGGVYTWTFQFPTQVLSDPNDPNSAMVPGILPVPMTVTLSQQLQSIAADTFTSAYESAVYEVTPSLATIDGSYTTGSTGIGSTMYPDASVTVAASTQSISGTETTSFCGYSATIAPHTTGGNVYDVTAITFNDVAPGTCAYTGQTFTGVATFNAGKLTLTATNLARNKGFMVVATKQ